MHIRFSAQRRVNICDPDISHKFVASVPASTGWHNIQWCPLPWWPYKWKVLFRLQYTSYIIQLHHNLITKMDHKPLNLKIYDHNQYFKQKTIAALLVQTWPPLCVNYDNYLNWFKTAEWETIERWKEYNTWNILTSAFKLRTDDFTFSALWKLVFAMPFVIWSNCFRAGRTHRFWNRLNLLMKINRLFKFLFKLNEIFIRSKSVHLFHGEIPEFIVSRWVCNLYICSQSSYIVINSTSYFHH